jgi:hypothetical protein
VTRDSNGMQLRWNGTVEERYHRLELDGKRCDANSRRCTHPAIEIYTLLPAKEWEPIPGAAPIQKQACSRHRQQFINNPNYKVTHTSFERPNPKPETGPIGGSGPHRKAS